MTPAMIRARRPFFWKNAATFVVLTTITCSVYAYTYSFLGKDNFDDVPIPPISEEELIKLKKEYQAKKAADK
jgi:cytochrome c oxidase assembly factor 3